MKEGEREKERNKKMEKKRNKEREGGKEKEGGRETERLMNAVNNDKERSLSTGVVIASYM